MKLQNWELRLAQYFDDIRHEPFEWGLHDCLKFADGAIEAQTGELIFTDWYGRYKTEWGCLLNYRRQLRRTGFCDIIEAVDSRLSRFSGKIPPRGSIIGRKAEPMITGLILGVVISDKAVFLSEDGLQFVSIVPGDIFWSVE
jgi:hypothetical protein